MRIDLGIGLAVTLLLAGCAGPRALPAMPGVAPVPLAVSAPPAFARSLVVEPWTSLVDTPSVPSIGAICGGVIFGEDIHDPNRFQLWQVDAVVDRSDRSAIEAMYRLPPRDMPPRLFEVKRTQ